MFNSLKSVRRNILQLMLFLTGVLYHQWRNSQLHSEQGVLRGFISLLDGYAESLSWMCLLQQKLTSRLEIANQRLILNLY